MDWAAVDGNGRIAFRGCPEIVDSAAFEGSLSDSFRFINSRSAHLVCWVDVNFCSSGGAKRSISQFICHTMDSTFNVPTGLALSDRTLNPCPRLKIPNHLIYNANTAVSLVSDWVRPTSVPTSCFIYSAFIVHLSFGTLMTLPDA